LIILLNILEILDISLFRHDFIESIKEGDEEGTFITIQSFPFIAKIVFNMLWFFAFPIPLFNKAISYGYIHPIGIIDLISGLVNVLYIKYFVRGVSISFIRDNNIISLLSYFYIIFLLIIATGSLQL